MRLQQTLVNSFFHLLYPHICNGCGSDILDHNNLLCLQCTSELPHTNFAMHANNPVEKIFWGRLAVKSATSEFYFAKDSLIQTLIHELKYKGNKEIGFFLGKLMGKSMLGTNRFRFIDALIPLPLFAEKEFKRGYNQATILCEGIAETMNVPVLKNIVVRKRYTETQTKKHRAERWENVKSSFEIKSQENLRGKHLLLVDDVVTTGATLEACGNVILNVEDVQLSIATLAFATR